MGKELNAEWYDKIFKDSKHYSLENSGYSCTYRRLFKEVLNNLTKEDKILELGCGTGQLAEMIIDKGFTYIQGVDFSKEAIKIAKQRCNTDFIICDLNDYRFYAEYNCIVATEVFEHIINDIQIIERIKPDTKVIFSVPEYDYKSHVRFFTNKNEVKKRYVKYFKEYKIIKVARIFIFIGIKK